MQLTAVAIRHVAFEGLGSIEPALRQAGYTPNVYDACADDLWAIEPLNTDLPVVLDGPIGAFEDGRYPFLAGELHILDPFAASK